MLGDSRCEGKCYDGTTRLLHIRGRFRKRVWIKPKDIVQVGLREFQDEKADIVKHYTEAQVRQLIAHKLISDPSTADPWVKPHDTKKSGDQEKGSRAGDENERSDAVEFDWYSGAPPIDDI